MAKKQKTEQKTEKTDEKDAKIAELTDTLQRLQAEFENYKKRIDKESAEFVKFAEEDMIKSLLPILDNFELALKNHQSPQEFYKGVELIYAQFFQMLEDKGIIVIECKGCKFDPYKHEALLAVESSEDENKVLEELEKGYLLHDKVIRHAKVKIAKKKCDQGGK